MNLTTHDNDPFGAILELLDLVITRCICNEEILRDSEISQDET